MTMTRKKSVILALVVLMGFLLGRLAVRAALNFLMGGTLFGGNFL